MYGPLLLRGGLKGLLGGVTKGAPKRSWTLATRVVATCITLIFFAVSTIPATTGCGGSGPANPSISGPQPGVIYYIDDHLGSSHLVTDSLGNVLREESRYPYGLERSSQSEPQSESAVAVDYVYTGKEYDSETGLIYFGGRYYAPELGRWITPDPLFLEKEPKKDVETPKELNLYAYVQNSPINFIDDDGYATAANYISFSAGAYGGLRFTAGLVRDDKGNMGMKFGYSFTGSPNASLSLKGGAQYTNAETIYDLDKLKFSGGAAAKAVVMVGANYSHGDEGVKGVAVEAGLSVSLIPLPVTFSGGGLGDGALYDLGNPSEFLRETFSPEGSVVDYMKNAAHVPGMADHDSMYESMANTLESSLLAEGGS